MKLTKRQLRTLSSRWAGWVKTYCLTHPIRSASWFPDGVRLSCIELSDTPLGPPLSILLAMENGTKKECISGGRSWAKVVTGRDYALLRYNLEERLTLWMKTPDKP